MAICISVIPMSWPPRFGGSFPGLDARIMEKAVDQRADEIIPADQRLAVAETEMLWPWSPSVRTVAVSEWIQKSAPIDVAVIVDVEKAVETSGERGVSVLAGPRLGPGTLEEILCNGNVDLIGLTEKGKPLDLGTPIPDGGPETQASCPPPRWQVHRGRLPLQLSPRSSSCHPLVPWWKNRCRQSDHSLLVPPSCVHTPRRPPDHSTRRLQSQTETTAIGAPFPRPDKTLTDHGYIRIDPDLD